MKLFRYCSFISSALSRIALLFITFLFSIFRCSLSPLFVLFISLSFFVLFRYSDPISSNGTHKIRKSATKFKKSSSIYGRPAVLSSTSASLVNSAACFQSPCRKHPKNHPFQRQERPSRDMNMDFLLPQVPISVHHERESQKNANVLLLNGINSGHLNGKENLLGKKEAKQRDEVAASAPKLLSSAKMTKKKLKMAQTQLDKLTQINIHLHGMYCFILYHLSSSYFVSVSFHFAIRREFISLSFSFSAQVYFPFVSFAFLGGPR